jgi:hypothetical protein
MARNENNIIRKIGLNQDNGKLRKSTKKNIEILRRRCNNE